MIEFIVAKAVVFYSFLKWWSNRMQGHEYIEKVLGGRGELMVAQPDNSGVELYQRIGYRAKTQVWRWNHANRRFGYDGDADASIGPGQKW